MQPSGEHKHGLPSGEYRHGAGELVAPGERMMHEQSNVSVRGIGWFLVWFFVIMAVVHGLVWGIYTGILSQWRDTVDRPANAMVDERVTPPPPVLQPSPSHDTPPRVDVERMWADEKRQFGERDGWVKDDKLVIPPQVVEQVLRGAAAAPATRPAASVVN